MRMIFRWKLRVYIGYIVAPGGMLTRSSCSKIEHFSRLYQIFNACASLIFFFSTLLRQDSEKLNDFTES